MLADVAKARETLISAPRRRSLPTDSLKRLSKRYDERRSADSRSRLLGKASGLAVPPVQPAYVATPRGAGWPHPRRDIAEGLQRSHRLERGLTLCLYGSKRGAAVRC